MTAIREVATLTSKGQVTLPKSIRQALQLDAGSKITFDLQGAQVLVSRADKADHEDPAIAGLLALLEKDIQTGQRLTDLPRGVADSMLAALAREVDVEAEISGDVAL